MVCIDRESFGSSFRALPTPLTLVLPLLPFIVTWTDLRMVFVEGGEFWLFLFDPKVRKEREFQISDIAEDRMKRREL